MHTYMFSFLFLGLFFPVKVVFCSLYVMVKYIMNLLTLKSFIKTNRYKDVIKVSTYREH